MFVVGEAVGGASTGEDGRSVSGVRVWLPVIEHYRKSEPSPRALGRRVDRPDDDLPLGGALTRRMLVMALGRQSVPAE